MSKILEFDAILKENLKDIHFRSPDQTYESVLHCMVSAYNRALEDAVEIVGDRGDPEWSWRYCDWIESLKI
jgi:hypothetical protein